jgi:hypothetical protein
LNEETDMTALNLINGRKVALGFALMVLGFAAPNRSEACALTAFAYDPTYTDVYFQFSTDCPFDRWRAILKERPSLTTVGVVGANPPVPVTGASGAFHGLTCGTPYRLIIQVRWAPGDPWTTIKVQNFWTNPC